MSPNRVRRRGRSARLQLGGPVRCAGFTLIELIAVIVIMSILAVSVTPAISSIDTARLTGAAREVSRLLESARSQAVAAELPSGVAVDIPAQSISLYSVVRPGGRAIPTPDALGNPTPTLFLGTRFAGIRITSMTNGVAGSKWDAIWFGPLGEPFAGTSVGPAPGNRGRFVTDARIVLTGGRSQTVLVHRLTGLVEP